MLENSANSSHYSTLNLTGFHKKLLQINLGKLTIVCCIHFDNLLYIIIYNFTTVSLIYIKRIINTDTFLNILLNESH